MMETASKYKFSISLNVLNHLGINLYSSVPAVLSEVVANAWDADASRVDIDINSDTGNINITDDGHGMSDEDLNQKYLHVGYQRRESGEALSAKKKRPVMGRKGIGKLSLFSIADTVEVHSVKDGVKSGLIMNLPKIREAIGDGDEAVRQTYYPEEVPISDISIESGTKIIIRDLRKNVNQTSRFLKTRLARRFTVFGSKYGFQVSVNGDEITSADRNYFSKVQYLWLLGEDKNDYRSQATNVEEVPTIDNIVMIEGVEHKVSGWIGTLRGSGDTKDEGGESLNNISIIVRGKVAQEDILNKFGDAGIYAQYIVGEVHADFLDEDEKDDVATSSRQSLVEDDPRYLALRDYMSGVLNSVRRKWTSFRNEKGAKEASKNPKISEWMNNLDPDAKNLAKKIFGKIYQMGIEENVRNELFAQSVVVVEGLKYKKSLSKLNDLGAITSENIVLLSELFRQIDEIEATLYYRITKERMEIVKTLQQKVHDNDKEKLIQSYIFEHLWLLDPTWERATNSPVMEQAVKSEFGDIEANLSDKERDGRIDIKYKTSAGMNIIIELKRPSVNVTCLGLLNQVEKYREALKKCLENVGKADEPITTVCIVGKWPSDYDEENIKMLNTKNIIVITYDQLLAQTFKAYEEYLEQNKKAEKLVTFIDDLLKEN